MTEKTKTLDIVIPYVMSKQGQELKYCLRSIEKNIVFDGKVVVWIIGEKPDFVKNVKYVPMERVQGMDYMVFYDTTNKLFEAANLEKIEKGFVWLHDDTYFIAETTLKDIQELKALENMSKVKVWFKRTDASKKWQNLFKMATDILKKENRSIFNYETHCPRYYNKNRVLQLVKTHGLLANPVQFATLYYNTYYKNTPRLLMPWGDGVKLGVYKDFPFEVLKEKLRKNKFLNHGKNQFNDEMIKLLEYLFPEKSKFER